MMMIGVVQTDLHVEWSRSLVFFDHIPQLAQQAGRILPLTAGDGAGRDLSPRGR